jgi:prepilin-type N-terminal cleavage/methylation domain-containing protein
MADRHLLHDWGFSLVELMAVVAILGILVSVAFASYSVTAEDSRRITCWANLRTIRSAILVYQVENKGNLPPDLEYVRPDVRMSGGFAQCVSSGLPYAYDASTGGVSCPTGGHEVP